MVVYTRPARIVGREAELSAIDAFLTRTPERAGALLIEGEAGVGKTTIIRAALDLAERSELRVLFARPSAGEAELPYAGLGDLLAGLGAELPRLAAPQREAIEAAVGRGGGTVSGHALSRGVLEMLRVASADGDLVLAVDDVQWLDRATTSAVTFALRRLTDSRLRVLVAARVARGSTDAPPLGLAEWELHRLVVGPMSATELGALIRDRLGEQLPRPRLIALARSSGGNPMLALELVRQSADGLALPDAVAERLRSLPPDARSALSVAAAALRPTVDLLTSAGVERDAVRAALDAGVLELLDERLAFAHPLLGSVAYELLLPDERREIHARLAAASRDAVERGHHISRSTVAPDESAATLLERAADEAASRGDHAGAAAFALRAAELSPELRDEAAVRRELRAAAEFELAGDVEAAIRLDRSLVERLRPGVPRAQARRQLVSAALGTSMSGEDAVQELSRALDDAADDPAVQAFVHVTLGDCIRMMGGYEDSLAHARKAFDLAERAGAPATAATAMAYAAFAEYLLGRDPGRSMRLAAARLDDSVVSVTGYSPRILLGRISHHLTSFGEAESLFRQELAVAEEHGLELIEVLARSYLAESQLRAGRWADAHANARLALEHARQAGNLGYVTGTSYALAMTQALLGLHEEARSLSSESLAAAEAIQDYASRVKHRAVLGVISIGEDDPQAAADTLQPAWELMLENSLGDLSVFPVAQVLGEALTAVGRPDEARKVADTIRAYPAGGRPWCRAMSARIAALAASAEGDHAAARMLISEALDAHAELPEPFELARTLHIGGRVEQRARSWGAARTAFVAALEQFDSLGAARWAEKVSADIARLPGRRRADKYELTTREREVAELVARGLSNKEVAAALFVTVRTVEANLSKTYGKLGVRSRTELAARFGVGSHD